MAKGISVGVASDTREFDRGIRTGVIKPLEDASDALDDVAKDGDKAGGKLEKAFEDARKETSEFKKEQTELGKAMQRASKEGGDSYKTNVKAGTDSARESIKEMGDETRNVATETASSFDGSAESIAQAFQDVAANAFQGFGPAGLVAGLAAAAGIGLISAAMDQGGEDSDEFKAKVGDLTTELIDAGEHGKVSLDYIVDRIKDLATEADGVNLKDLDKSADDAGRSFKDLAQAYGGNADGLGKLQRESAAYKEKLEAEMLAAAGTGDAAQLAIGKKIDALGPYNAYLGDAKKQADAAAEAERLYVQAGGPELERKAALVGTIDAAYDAAAGAVDDYVNKESGIFDTGAYITAMQTRSTELANYRSNLEKSGLTPAAKTFLDSQGQEAAAQFLAGYTAAEPAQKTELNRIWTEGGSTSSGSFTKAMKAGLPADIAGPKIKLDAPDMGSIIDKLQAKANKNPIKFSAVVVDRKGKEIP